MLLARMVAYVMTVRASVPLVIKVQTVKHHSELNSLLHTQWLKVVTKPETSVIR